MQITPKYQKGGHFNQFFTTYVPIKTESPSQTSSSSKRSTKDSSEKGELTEKDFFKMITDSMDLLPNEMSAIVGNLMTTFRMNHLTGIDTGDLATSYLSNLYQLKIAAQNKTRYDAVLADASKSGSLAEPAISMDGKLIVQNNDGKIGTVDLEEYNTNRDKYKGRVLTVSNLANLRKYDPSLVNDQNIFDIIDNSIGFEEFQTLLTSAVQSLGSTETTSNGMFSVAGQASKGLALLDTLRADDRVRAMGSITAQGLYEYKIIDKNQLQQLEALTNYITTVLPDRAKTWAAFKTGRTDKDKATQELIFNALLGRTNVSHSFNIDYKGSMEKAQGKTGSSSSSSSEPKLQFWNQVQRGFGGEDMRFTILNNQGSMSVDSKYYGALPGLDNNMSLGDFINASQIGYMVRNNKGITFGDQKLSIDSFNDVMVNAFAGAAVVTLPVKGDGTPYLDLAQDWIDIQDKLKEVGYSPNTPEYDQYQKKLIKDAELDELLDSNGNLIGNKIGQFFVLEGYTSDKAKAVQGTKQVPFDDVESDYILSVKGDDALYDTIRTGLTNKDRGKYELNDNSLWGNDLFRGNIYIPINNNLNNGANADNTELKTPFAELYEKSAQAFQNEQRNSSSNL